MKKRQVIKFWEDLCESTEVQSVLTKYSNRPGYPGKRTLERYVQAATGFQQGLGSDEISKKTGWSKKRLGQIGIWWKEWRTEINERINGEVVKLDEEIVLSPQPAASGSDYWARIGRRTTRIFDRMYRHSKEPLMPSSYICIAIILVILLIAAIDNAADVIVQALTP